VSLHPYLTVATMPYPSANAGQFQYAHSPAAKYVPRDAGENRDAGRAIDTPLQRTRRCSYSIKVRSPASPLEAEPRQDRLARPAHPGSPAGVFLIPRREDDDGPAIPLDHPLHQRRLGPKALAAHEATVCPLLASLRLDFTHAEFAHSLSRPP
jgi:hypothetical protein